MSTEKDWVTYPVSADMTQAAEELGGRLNEIWGYGPASERILTKKWGENHIVGAMGHWAVGQEFVRWGVMPLDTPIFENHGDSYDYILPRIGFADVKTKQLHSRRIVRPDRVEVNVAQAGNPDVYVFCCVHTARKVLWILGWMRCVEYRVGATLWKAGEKYDGWECLDDMLVNPISALWAMAELRGIITQRRRARER